MAFLKCLKCGARVSDEYLDPCPGIDDSPCGAREWVWMDEPKKIYPITKKDRAFLKSGGIGPD